MKLCIIFCIFSVLTVALAAPQKQDEYCTYNGQQHHIDESFPSADGCNTCFCQPKNMVACTLMACFPSREICHYNGKEYFVNDKFPSQDNCNMCFCQGRGRVACTYRACIPSDFLSRNRN